MTDKLNPWQQPPLNEWYICGMNHYRVLGIKYLYVAMVKNDVCIKEEGIDDEYLWNRLWHKANIAEIKML
jgi:hypothetical protein